MRIGLLLLPTDPWRATLARVRQLDRLGYDHLWTYDHLSWRHYRDRPWFGAIPWLTGVAAATERIRLGTLVASPNFRHPVTLAKDAMTLDHISAGRLTLGVGAGGLGFDATVLGGSAPDAATRGARFREFTTLLDQLLRNPATNAGGEYYTAVEARMVPGCVQQPRLPLAVAGTGPKGLALAARLADTWIATAPGQDGETAAEIATAVAGQLARLDEACGRAGRDPASIGRLFLADDEPEHPLRDVPTALDFLARYAALGFTDVVFQYPRPEFPPGGDDPAVLDALAAELWPVQPASSSTESSSAAR